MAKRKRIDYGSWWKGLALAFFIIAGVMLPARAAVSQFSGQAKDSAEQGLSDLELRIERLEATEKQSGIEVVKASVINSQLDEIRANIFNSGQYAIAKIQISSLTGNLIGWNNSLIKKNKARAEAEAAAAKAEQAARAQAVAAGVNVPILIYHYTPPDFEQQLLAIRAKGYTTITPDQLVDALSGRSVLPGKSVIITFDDGFSSQLKAFSLLQKYQMKATYYIITGGAASNWCIGAGRRYNQAQACGDSYLNWDQIKTLDRSGLIEIGAHTVNHLALSAQPAEVQRSEIFDSKATIEYQLGHSVSSFAYPYGSFNALTISLVQQAGFTSAVTTAKGMTQTLAGVFTMPRVRSAAELP